MRLLIVEDEPDMNRILAERMQMEQFVVDRCTDGLTAYQYLQAMEYDAVILDVMIPGMDGYALLRRLRQEQNTTPVLLLTARDSAEDIVQGLDCGADDYLVKPFDFSVLLARLRAMLRRAVGVHENVYTCGDLEVHPMEQQVFRGGREIVLSGREYQILLYLIRNQNLVLTRDQIQNNVWNDDGGKASNVVDVYIRYLRRKIDDDYEKKLIHTIRGAGYRLSCQE